jgi:hypothetical protein
MKLDLLSLEKGINEELSKQADAAIYNPSTTFSSPANTGPVYRDGLVTGLLDWSPEIGAALTGPWGWGVLGAGKLQGLIEKYAPETHKQWLDNSGWIYRGLNNMRHSHDAAVGVSRVGSKAIDAGGEILGEAINATGAPEAMKAMTNATSSTPGLQQVGDKIDSFGREAKNAGGWFPWLRQKAQESYDTGVKGISNALGGEAGRYLMPALGTGALVLGANYLLGGNKKRRYAGAHGQAPVINVNVGGGGQNPGMLNYSRSGVQSLGAPVNLSSSYGMDNKYGMDMVKHAFDVTELLTKAVQQRAINKAIDKFQEVPTQTESTPAEEEIEITSKYPEVAKLLKDEQNKAYLDRLLKE